MYSPVGTKEWPNETILSSLKATFATAFTKGMSSCMQMSHLISYLKQMNLHAFDGYTRNGRRIRLRTQT